MGREPISFLDEKRLLNLIVRLAGVKAQSSVYFKHINCETIGIHEFDTPEDIFTSRHEYSIFVNKSFRLNRFENSPNGTQICD